jgi:hypothetical protein
MEWEEIISGLGLLAMIIGVYSKNKADMKGMEIEIINIKDRQNRDQKRVEDNMLEIREDISKVFDKIDELKDLLIKK